jgi:hypothetical protein
MNRIREQRRDWQMTWRCRTNGREWFGGGDDE